MFAPFAAPAAPGQPPIAICIRVPAPPSGWVSPGTLEDATITQTPNTTNATASGRVNRQPPGIAFSAKITPARTAVQVRLITPSANSSNISPQQQPTQYAPCLAP